MVSKKKKKREPMRSKLIVENNKKKGSKQTKVKIGIRIEQEIVMILANVKYNNNKQQQQQSSERNKSVTFPNNATSRV